uniref:hypothetical protein n=1 Tax=Nostoc sp. CMAA1605 TaxID=2055159 RepID=UPI001F45021A
NLDLKVDAPLISLQGSYNIGGGNKGFGNSWSAFSDTFHLYNNDISLFKETWQLGGFNTPQINFAAI